MAVAMFQPATRAEISEMFGREISRDLIAALREDGLIAAGPRSPKLGAPYTYVTTEKFLVEFGFESLRDLPDIEALKDAGLMREAVSLARGNGTRQSRTETAAPVSSGRKVREIAWRSRTTSPRMGRGFEIAPPSPVSLLSLRIQAYLNLPRSDRRGQIGDIPRPEGTGRQGRCASETRETAGRIRRDPSR